jgi:hypothetical protein
MFWGDQAGSEPASLRRCFPVCRYPRAAIRGIIVVGGR